MRTPPARLPATDQAEPAAAHDRFANTPGHPLANGTLPMARYLTDPTIEDEVQALAAQAPPMTEDQRAKLARLIPLNQSRRAASG